MKATEILRETWWWNIDPPEKPPELRAPRPEEETGVVASSVLRRLAGGAMTPKRALAWADYLLAYGSITSREEGSLELAASGLALLRATIEGRARGPKKEVRLKSAMARLATACASGDERCRAFAEDATAFLRKNDEHPTVGLARALGEEGGRAFGLEEKEFLRRAGGAKGFMRRMKLLCGKLLPEAAAFVVEGEKMHVSGVWLSRLERSGRPLFRTSHPQPLMELAFPAVP